MESFNMQKEEKIINRWKTWNWNKRFCSYQKLKSTPQKNKTWNPLKVKDPNMISVMRSATIFVDHFKNWLQLEVSGNISLSGGDGLTKDIYYLELLSIFVNFI